MALGAHRMKSNGVWEGRRAVGLAVLFGLQLLASRCGGGAAPTDAAAKCPSNYAGTYTATFSGTSCALPTEKTIVVEQLGCHVQVYTTEGAFHGTIDQTGTWEFDYYPADQKCFAISGGRASLFGSTISGSYQGTTVFSGCCSPFAVNFTWTR